MSDEIDEVEEWTEETVSQLKALVDIRRGMVENVARAIYYGEGRTNDLEVSDRDVWYNDDEMSDQLTEWQRDDYRYMAECAIDVMAYLYLEDALGDFPMLRCGDHCWQVKAWELVEENKELKKQLKAKKDQNSTQ